MKHKEAYRARHQQFSGTCLEPFFGGLLLQCIACANASKQEKEGHEPRIEYIHDNILVLLILWVFTKTANTTEDAFIIVEIKNVVKQHQKHRHPTEIIDPMLTFHYLPSPNISSILS